MEMWLIRFTLDPLFCLFSFSVSVSAYFRSCGDRSWHRRRLFFKVGRLSFETILCTCVPEFSLCLFYLPMEIE